MKKTNGLFHRVTRMPKIEQINELPNGQLFKLKEIADLMGVTWHAVYKWSFNYEDWFVIRYNQKRRTIKMRGSMVKLVAEYRAQQYRASHSTQKEEDK